MDPQPDENLTWERRANHVAGMRAVGGMLALTDKRLVFEPNGVDKATGGKSWEAHVSQLAGAEVAGRDFTGLFNGGIRKRLRLKFSGGSEELFVIGDVEQVANELDALAS